MPRYSDYDSDAFLETPLEINQTIEEDVWELDPDLDDNYSDTFSIKSDWLEEKKEPSWPKRAPRPPVSFLIKHAPSPYPRKPIEQPELEGAYKAWCEKKVNLEKKVKEAQVEVNESEVLITAQEEKIKGLNAWANKTSQIQIKDDLKRRLDKAKAQQAQIQKESEEFQKSDFSLPSLHTSYIGVKKGYEEFITVRNEGWKRVYGKVDALRSTGQIMRYYSPTVGPIESKENGTTYFEFPEYVDVSSVVRELLMGGHEYIQRSKVWQGLYLDTVMLKSFEK
jgi:hypothetical protein